MMNRMRKISNSYFFSVEGETEKLYLDWLQKEINSESSSTHNACIKAKVEKDPMRFVKTIPILNKTEVWHLLIMREALLQINTFNIYLNPHWKT